MKLLFLLVALVSLCTENQALPVGQDGSNEDVRTQCIHELLSVLAKPDGSQLQPKCKEILNTGTSFTHPIKAAEGVLPPEQGEKKHEVDSHALAQKNIKELLKASGKEYEHMDEDRSQEEYPQKRYYALSSKEKPEEQADERSQEEFPTYEQKRHNFMASKGKRDDPDYDRSQEDFPNFVYKRNKFLTGKEKRDDPDYDRSQEDFPNFVYKRNKFLTGKEKRDDPDYDRSQEDFPNFVYKRNKFLTGKEKRDDPDYDRSQEDFPNFVYKRHNILTGKEKRDDPDYDRSQEDFPSFVQKRHHILSGKDKHEDPDYYASQEDSIDDKERDKRYWRPSHKYHQRRRHKRGDEGTESEEEEKWTSYHQRQPKHHEESFEEDFEKIIPEESEDSEVGEMGIWKPTHTYNHKKHFLKQDGSETESDATQEEKKHNIYDIMQETFKHQSPEEEELIVRDPSENKHHYTNNEELKRHQGPVEEQKQKKEAVLRYLLKKRNELEERLLNERDDYEKHNPWLHRGYYDPAWNIRSPEGNQRLTDPNAYQKLEDLANALRYKMGLLSQKESSEGGKAYLHQSALAPEELQELEKLAAMEQLEHIN